MFRSAVVCATLVAAGISAPAHADGVDFIPFGPGGVQWNVSPAGFQTPSSYGQATAQGYDVPFAGTLRAGCYVVSDWLPVTHRDGYGEFIADVYSTWEGEVFFRTNPFANVFNLQVEIRAASGAVTTQRRTVTSASYQLEPIYFPTPDSVLYWGELDNSLSHLLVLQNFSVHQDDWVRVSVCDLVAGSSMTVRKLVMRTVPFDN